MRVLVTGATGFVGGHLVRRLANDHHVVAVTRRAESVPGASEIRLVPTIDSTTKWAGLLEDIDVVLHLAARVHIMHETADDPLEAFREINARGTAHLAASSAAQGVRRFVFMSSIKVNGGQTINSPFKASDPACPVDPYGLSKWEAEQALVKVSDTTEMESVVLRPTVVYGEGVKGNIERIVRLLKTRVPLPFGRVMNRRTMLSVDNLAQWVMRAVDETEVPEGPVLIGDPEPISTRTLASALGAGLGLQPRMVPVPVTWMSSVAAVLGQAALSQRLFGNLESVPTFEAFPGIRAGLEDSASALHNLGAAMRREVSAEEAGAVRG